MEATTTSPRTISFATPQASFRHSSGLKKDMSITQTYYLAHKARGKLSRQAAKPDHDLRLLVGHANLLDTLMLELADAEREQERWFNQSVASSTAQKQQERHVQWAEEIREEDEEEYDSDSSSDDDYEEDEDIIMANTPSLRPSAVKATSTTTTVHYVPSSDDDEDDAMTEDNLEEDYAQLELVRTPSHASPPPELLDDSDSSEDESMPPSPPQPSLPMPDTKNAKDVVESQEQESLFQGGLYLSQPTSSAAAITVY